MRSSFRWLVPVAVVATVAGGAVINSAVAGGSPRLPERSPQQVLESVAASHGKVTSMSGTVVTHADLGLPSLPKMGNDSSGSGSATDMQGLITRFLNGDNTLRVWSDGPTRERVQLMDSFDELNVVRNGTDVWTYDSRKDVAQHGTVPQHSDTAAKGSAAATAQDLTPAEAAKRVLDAADPTTSVTLGDPQVVAGRSAYALTLTPKTSKTLIGRIVIAVDSDRGVPLQVQVYARGKSKPAIETGFTKVDFSRPSASTFTFAPPKGATVREIKPGTTGGTSSGTSGADKAGTKAGTDKSGNHPKPTVIGKGWSAITELPAGSSGAFGDHATSGASGSTAAGTDASGAKGAASGQDLLRQVTTPVANGRAITTALMSVLITDDGRVFAGSVPVQSLIDAAKK
jgi:outer membrane lipoprotein-sorting protein